MERNWFQKLFGHVSKSGLKDARVRADAGDAEAQFGLGVHYAGIGGAEPDYAQAAQWYRKAADQSHSLAQFNLGTMHAEGQGLPVDDAEAMVWFGKAARQGDAGAQFNVGMRHYRASVDGPKAGATESRLEAFKWLHLASVQGYKNSDAACERISLSMTREEMTEGTLRVRGFVVREPGMPEVR